MNPLNIFMTADTYAPALGGAEVHVFELQKRLRASGHRVHLFVTEIAKDPRDYEFPVERVAWSFRRIPSIFLRIWRSSRGADVYHSHYSYKLAALTGIVARVRCKHFVITLHGMGILDHPDTPWIYDKAHRLYRWIALRCSTHIISTSEDLATVCKRRYSRASITVIPNGIDAKLLDPAVVAPSQDPRLPPNTHPLIMTFRRLVPKNGIHFLISAMPFILKELPNANLVIVGDGRMRQALEQRATRLGVDHACVFFGAILNNEVPPMAMRADVVVFPSTAESTSIACGEMMSLERSIVASRVGGLIELIGKNNERGRLVKLVPWEECDYEAPDELPVDRYQELSRAIIESIDSSESESRRFAARTFALEQLDWDVIVSRTVLLFRSLC